MKIAVVGTGYVGLATGIVQAYLGNEVICLDNDHDKIEKLKRGILTIYEPGLEELFDSSRDNISFTTDYRQAVTGAEIIIISVGTPSNADGTPNVKSIHEAATRIGQSLARDNVIIVNKSTVPIGSGKWVEMLIREAFRARNDPEVGCAFHVVSNPEFLREGSAIYDTLYPDRIVLGTDNEYAKDKMVALLKPIMEHSFEKPLFLPDKGKLHQPALVITDMVTAELIKYSSNAFLALKISFINEIGCISEMIDADILKVAEGVGLDKRIGPDFLKAGIGWGGSCFGKDTITLINTAKEYGLHLNIIDACIKVNSSMRSNMIKKIQAELKILKGKTIGIMGLSFKPDTDDLRDSPAVDIAKKLVGMGTKVRAFDPMTMEKARQEFDGLDIEYVSSYEKLFDKADAVVLATEWLVFREVDWAGLINIMRIPLVFDGRNFLDRARLEKIGYKVIGVGR